MRSLFLPIVRFEVAYQLRRPSTYLYFALLFLLAFALIAASGWGTTGRVMANAPFTLAEITMNLVMIAQVVTAAFIGLAVLRDFDMRSHELFFTTRITKASYLGGRFTGAMIVMALMFTAIPLGLMLATFMPWLDAATLLPFHAWHYLSPYFLLALPTLLAMGALFFAVGIATRSHLAVYVLGFALLMADTLVDKMRTNLANDAFTAFMDPFGSATFYLVTRYWTAAEKNAQTVTLAGAMLTNRLFLLAMAAVLVAVAIKVFRFDAMPHAWRSKRASAPSTSDKEEPIELALPSARQNFARGRAWREFVASARFAFAWIVRAMPFVAVSTIAVIGIVASAWSTSRQFAAPYLLTYIMAQNVTGGLGIVMLVLVTLYAGELVWHDRQLKSDELVDSLPVSSTALMTGRIAGLLGAIAALYALGIAVAMAVQTFTGYTHYEPLLYLKYIYLTEFPVMVSFVLFAFVVHTMLDNKYFGHLLMIVLIGVVLTLDSLGFEHRLYQPGVTPAFVYSDLNGFAPYVAKLAWYPAYWISMGMALLVVAGLFVVRGTDRGRASRMVMARARATRPTITAAGAFAVIALMCGGAIYYNSNVLATYRPTRATLDLRERYERAFGSLRDLPQPQLVAETLHVQLEPEHLRVSTSGRLSLVNASGRPIDSLLISDAGFLLDGRAEIDSLRFDGPAQRLSASDSTLGVRLYRLATPLADGDTMTLSFTAVRRVRGFVNGKGDNGIANNGTFVGAALPGLGYAEGFEIDDPLERKRRKLSGKRGRLPPLADSGKVPTEDRSWGRFDVRVSTAPDQIVVAPGELRRDGVESGRRQFQYAADVDGNLGNSFVSARFAVSRDTWIGPRAGDSVAIAVYHHPTHTYNVERMVRASKRSLAYFTSAWGPYPFRQFRILEYPRYDYRAYALAATIPFSEGAGFIINVSPAADGVDQPFYITAHEMAHQWWGLQLRGAPLEGSRMLNESLAQYGQLMVLQAEYGELPTRLLRNRMMDNYLNGRSQERNAEQPIIRNQSQDYLVYPKGGVVMYALADYIGEDRVNAALRSFLAKHHLPAGAPNTMDLMREFRAVTPDSLQSVITDLFETITLFANKTDSATYTKRADGKYVVRIAIDARKVRADSLGAETPIPVDDYVDIGVFGAPVKGDPLGAKLYLAKHKLGTGAATIEVVVDQVPLKAGIDPHRILVDRVFADNVVPAQLKR